MHAMPGSHTTRASSTWCRRWPGTRGRRSGSAHMVTAGARGRAGRDVRNGIQIDFQMKLTIRQLQNAIAICLMKLEMRNCKMHLQLALEHLFLVQSASHFPCPLQCPLVVPDAVEHSHKLHSLSQSFHNR